MEKQPFPFDPFVDSLLGEKILAVWQLDHHSKDKLETSMLRATNLAKEQICFTSNANKQVLMVSYPKEFREKINSQDYDSIAKRIFEIAIGNDEKPPALDIALELLEWLLTGFDLENVVEQSLSKIFGVPFGIPFLERVRAEYIKELRG
ncbi:MAG: VanZ family protein [Leptospira sp.]|nr:VanZ family protein [Leptospira sp.]